MAIISHHLHTRQSTTQHEGSYDACMSEAADQVRARLMVGQRSDNHCEMAIPDICTGGADTIHHRRKRRFKDTLWSPSNLLAACGDGVRGCHGYVEAHPAWSIEQGLWVRSTEDPRTGSVHMRSGNQRSWYWLDDDGGAVHVSGNEFERITAS